MVERLLDEGHEVVVIDNMSAESNDNFHWNKSASNHKLDISNKEAVRNLFDGVDYVFHMAAESRIMNTIGNPVKAVTTNSLGTATVLQCSREAGCRRVVYSSTSSTYGKNPPPNNETMSPDCLNPYSSSKYAGEMLCRNYSELFDLQTVILRYFNVYGIRQPEKGQYAPVTAIFSRQKRAGQPLTVVGDGLQRRDFVNVKDVVEANFLAATREIPRSLFGTAFNVGTGTNHSILEIAKWMSEEVTFLPERPGEMRETLADISKISLVLGWRPTVDLEDYVKNEMR